MKNHLADTYCDVHVAGESGMGPEYRFAMSTQLVDHTELCMTFCNVDAAMLLGIIEAAN
jgi:hypothetical protein